MAIIHIGGKVSGFKFSGNKILGGDADLLNIAPGAEVEGIEFSDNVQIDNTYVQMLQDLKAKGADQMTAMNRVLLAIGPVADATTIIAGLAALWAKL